LGNDEVVVEKTDSAIKVRGERAVKKAKLDPRTSIDRGSPVRGTREKGKKIRNNSNILG